MIDQFVFGFMFGLGFTIASLVIVGIITIIAAALGLVSR